MTRKLRMLSVTALVVVAICVPALTAAAEDDGPALRERADFGRTAPELERTTTWNEGSTGFLQEIWERILRLVPRLPGPEDKDKPPRPEAQPTIDPIGWDPKSG